MSESPHKYDKYNSLCLIDPFINARKYCNWHVTSFPDGSAAVHREIELAKDVPQCLCPHVGPRYFCTQTWSSSGIQLNVL